jgi:hypothetical protein
MGRSLLKASSHAPAPIVAPKARHVQAADAYSPIRSKNRGGFQPADKDASRLDCENGQTNKLSLSGINAIIE